MGSTDGDAEVLKRLVIASSFVLGAMLSFAGVASADDILVVGFDGVEEFYYTQADCEADGPNVRLQINDQAYPYWYCRIGDDRGDNVHWYLYNTDIPPN
ncbi:hypothetical protein M2272_001479 [Mycobacterium frederiksbergense]|uniref:Uncharacterized protein n=1 Tax=Mycolicibacterium frederiksbergense TaxID=117567 RepID=A0ABT6KVV8_9MYCO|nr:hypothetical protein [Mycolicibacterium frederiksbergense]MDH6194850.1 hypothetical protein [Mycolicibacterium frederiksbergense]